MKPRSGYIFKRGQTWWIQYDVDGKRFRESLGTREARQAKTAAARILEPHKATAEAERLAAIAARIKTAKDVAASGGKAVTLAQAWSKFVGLDAETRPYPGTATMAMYESLWNAFSDWLEHAAPSVKTLKAVHASHAVAFVKHLHAQRLSAGRVNKYKRFLKMFFRVMAASGGILENPFGNVKTQEDNQIAKQPFTVEELRKIVGAADGELKTLFLLGFGTGLRLGDCATLLWGECDLARRKIERVPRKTSRKGKAVKIGLPAELAAHLASLRRSGPYVLPGLAEEYEAGHVPEISKRIQAHLKACGIQTVKPGTGEGTKKRAVVLKGFHSFRHSYVSLNADAGTPQATMQKLVGHGSPAMTMHYLTPSDNMVLKAADSLPCLLSSGVVPQPQKREPLPAWVLNELQNMTTDNWRDLRNKIIAGG